jgi:site-specific recombinase XerC
LHKFDLRGAFALGANLGAELSSEADIAKAQEWLGHSNVSTTRLYDRRKTKPEDSPIFHVKY